MNKVAELSFSPLILFKIQKKDYSLKFRNMEHSFNIDLASQYGIEEAVIIQNMFFWIRHNVANRKHFHDNRYWTYNTVEALGELFPYMSESKIYRCMKKLSEDGFILKGNYNDKSFDRTCWYAFSDKATTFLQSVGMDLFKMKNGSQQNEETIPDSKQQIVNTDSKPITTTTTTTIVEDEINKIDYNFIKSEWERICPTLSSIRCLNTKRRKSISNTLKSNNASVEDMIKCFKIINSSEFCKGDNKQQWKATFDWIISDTKSCFNRLLEGEFSKNRYERKLYESIINGEEEEERGRVIIGGVVYK